MFRMSSSTIFKGESKFHPVLFNHTIEELKRKLNSTFREYTQNDKPGLIGKNRLTKIILNVSKAQTEGDLIKIFVELFQTSSKKLKSRIINLMCLNISSDEINNVVLNAVNYADSKLNTCTSEGCDLSEVFSKIRRHLNPQPATNHSSSFGFLFNRNPCLENYVPYPVQRLKLNQPITEQNLIIALKNVNPFESDNKIVAKMILEEMPSAIILWAKNKMDAINENMRIDITFNSLITLPSSVIQIINEYDGSGSEASVKYR